ncbi:hypothetical protein ASPZODRAFT_142335 [Penicilliopsis zonata CBS 506.65]|uniref:Uncharacterized protein n=1 Tax=Penicilliopsis zonata CBS 506.65 TaxID=1073090 RepID=A0A1L9SH51_9EURO|nr:hypothetical protein ASPZODRAFT_142335 [Penicilliopsis zonata CBS 506.65]OJJ46522.1 hypothetical protein ASPZODRAFT_142335 [Penicilliopsis zonata CBS 506.65]
MDQMLTGKNRNGQLFATAESQSAWDTLYDGLDLLYGVRTPRKASRLWSHCVFPLADWDVHSNIPSATGFAVVWTAFGSRRKSSATPFFLLFLCLVLCGLHMLGWTYEFPGLFEAWAWRSATIAIAILPPLILAHSNVAESLDLPWLVDACIPGILILLYMVCRLFMIVECFASFRQAQAEIKALAQKWRLFANCMSLSLLSRKKLDKIYRAID